MDLDTLNPSPQRYNHLRAYNHSKLCNVLFANALSRKLKGHGVTVFSLHPGMEPFQRNGQVFPDTLQTDE
jgi:NAD(P)-dependent dehydrogenase (short-subunit alcohol dehydrogenase family)